MNTKIRTIIGWVLASLIAVFLIFLSSPAKFGIVKGLDSMFESMGLTGNEPFIVGVVEVFCALMFLIPRTGVIGTLLLSSYMGGVIVTHLEHDNQIVFGIVFEIVVWITAFIRFPELGKRILGKRLN